MVVIWQWTWTTIILIHRPFYSYWQEQGWLPSEFLPTESHPLDVSFAAAEKICQILDIHVENLQRFPCDLIYPIFTTASTLSHYRQLHRGTSVERTITPRLAMCVKWLSILGSNWKNAGKSKEKLTKGWSARAHYTLCCDQLLPSKANTLLLSDLGMASRRDLEPNLATSTPRQLAQGVALPSILAQDVQDVSRVSAGNLVPSPERPRGPEGVAGIDDLSANIDWAFLNMLGDADDELYAMNNDFRGFLGNGLELSFDGLSGD